MAVGHADLRHVCSLDVVALRSVLQVVGTNEVLLFLQTIKSVSAAADRGGCFLLSFLYFNLFKLVKDLVAMRITSQREDGGWVGGYIHTYIQQNTVVMHNYWCKSSK